MGNLRQPLIFILLFFIMISCSYPDPRFTQAYYVFKNREGDLFEKDSTYRIENLYGINENGYRRLFDYQRSFVGVNYFKIDLWGESPLYIDYGNGDFDTLLVTWGPSNVNPYDHFYKLSFMRWELNGKIIANWDFKKDPDLRDSIYRINTEEISIYRTEPPVPVIISK